MIITQRQEAFVHPLCNKLLPDDNHILFHHREDFISARKQFSRFPRSQSDHIFYAILYRVTTNIPI